MWACLSWTVTIIGAVALAGFCYLLWAILCNADAAQDEVDENWRHRP